MRPLDVLHEDERSLAVLKPPGLLTVPPPKKSSQRQAPHLVQRLRDEGHQVHAVHRLDKETSGVVLLAKDPEAREILMRAFRDREVKKTYLAFVTGRPKPAEGTISLRIKDLGAKAIIARDGQPAETRYRTLETFAQATLLEVEPYTGRHNQIRIHFAHLGHALVGERKYAFGRDASVRHKRCALHASALAFPSPADGRQVSVQAPLTRDLDNLVEKLRG